MKISMLLILTSLLISSILTAQGNRSENIKIDTIKPVVRIKPFTLDSSMFTSSRRPPVFKTYSINELRTQTRGVKPINLEVSANTGNDEKVSSQTGNVRMALAYKSGNGVVLNALTPKHAGTGSELFIHNVVYSQLVAEKIRSNTSFPVPQTFADDYLITTVGTPSNPYVIVEKVIPISAIAKYNDLPVGTNTFLLTFGTDLNKDSVVITLDYETHFEGDQLIKTPGSNEIRLLFTYKVGANRKLLITIRYKGGTMGFIRYFDHLQLVQLD